MTRPPRSDPEGGWHHVMNRGVDRRPIFFDDIDRHEFGRLLGVAHDRFGIEVHAYCLMTNHFHLLVRCPTGHVSDAMHCVSSLYARFVNDRIGRVGHLFGDRFTSRLVTHDRYIVNAVRYIHRNPLDMAGISDPEHYRWSSHRTYLGHRRPLRWMRTSPVLDWFPAPSAFARFVSDDPSIERPSAAIDPRELLAAVDAVLAERSEADGRTLRSQARAISLHLGAERGCEQTILEALGARTPSAIRTARWRARRYLSEHPDTIDLAASVDELIAPGPAAYHPAA